MENKLTREENGRNEVFQNIASTPFLSSSKKIEEVDKNMLSVEENKGYEERKLLRDAFSVIQRFNNLPFYPQEAENITEIMNGFSSNECNKFNEVFDKFKEIISDWDYRG